MGLVTVARFVDPPSAHLARGLLEANGIEAFVFNEHYVGMDWLHSQAIGGVEVRVVSEQASQARALLADPPRATPADDARAEVAPDPAACPRCRSLRTRPDRLDHRLRALSLAIGLPLASGRDLFRCEACGQVWRHRPRHRGFLMRLADLLVLGVVLVGSALTFVLRRLNRVAERVLGRPPLRTLECWACGTPFRSGDERCAQCDVRHPPVVAFDRVIQVGRAYDATCPTCHTPYVREDYVGPEADWRCSMCRGALVGVEP